MLPKVNFSGLNLSQLHTPSWVLARDEMIRALESYGAFEVIYDGVPPEIREGLLGRAIPELFSEKVVEEGVNLTHLPYHGFWMHKEGFPFLSMQLADLNSLAVVEKFASTIWPQGNSYFSNMVWKYAIQMQELIQIIHRMILEGLGLDYLYETFIQSVTYSMRFSKYHDDDSTHITDVALPPHKDPNYLSIIGQHKLDGLEVERSNGEWIHVSPLPNSFIVLLGEVLMAWSNGRFRAATHRVKMDVSKKRYSIVYSTLPSQSNDTITSLKDLVDEDHPSLYKPFNYYEYLKFKFSNEGDKYKDTLMAYCGVH